MNGKLSKNIVLIGFMGAGKTTLGEVLAKKLRVPFVDTDQLIEQEQQRAISCIFEEEGEAAFRKMETETLRKLSDGKKCVISVGGGLPVQPQNHELLKQLGITVYLKAQKETLVKRLQGDTTRPLLQGGDLLEKIETLMNQREDVYEQVADLILQTDNKQLEEVLEELIRGLTDEEVS